MLFMSGWGVKFFSNWEANRFDFSEFDLAKVLSGYLMGGIVFFWFNILLVAFQIELFVLFKDFMYFWYVSVLWACKRVFKVHEILL